MTEPTANRKFARFDGNATSITELARVLAGRMSRRTGVPADDLQQEGMIAAWTATPEWPAGAHVGWFAKVINWRMIDYVRRVRGESRRDATRPADVEYTDASHDYSDDHDATADVDNHLILLDLFKSNPRDTAAALRLEKGWVLREIAAEDGISESSICRRRHLFFARARAANGTGPKPTA